MSFKWWKIDDGAAQSPYYLVINEQFIAQLDSSDDQSEVIEQQLNNNLIPDSGHKISLSSIQSVSIQEGHALLSIQHDQGQFTHYPIRAFDKIFGAFHHLKENNENASYSLVKPSALKASKTIILSAILLSILFGAAYYHAIAVEAGEVPAFSFFPINLLASLGSQTLTFTYTLLAGLCLILLLQKVGRPVVKHVLTFE